MAKDRGVDAILLLSEIQELLIATSQRVLQKMAEIDQRLRGWGNIEKVELRPIDDEANRLREFVEERILCELAMWKPKWRFEKWYEGNKFLVWLVGIIVALGSLAANLF